MRWPVLIAWVVCGSLVSEARAEVGVEPAPRSGPEHSEPTPLPEPAQPPLSAVDQAPLPGLADGWSFELLVVAEPEQTRDVQCNRGVDCMTAAKAFFGGAARATLQVPESWSIAMTLGLAHHIDQEERPIDGYSVLSLRFDVQVELGRKRDVLGAALRVSPMVALAWADTGSTFTSDIPGFALLIGRTDVWGEVAVPTMPTPADPRLFHLGVGWRHPRISGVAGLGTFATLGYQRDELDRSGSAPGVFANIETPITADFDLTFQLALSRPIVVALGFRVGLEGK